MLASVQVYTCARYELRDNCQAAFGLRDSKAASPAASSGFIFQFSFSFGELQISDDGLEPRTIKLRLQTPSNGSSTPPLDTYRVILAVAM